MVMASLFLSFFCFFERMVMAFMLAVHISQHPNDFNGQSESKNAFIFFFMITLWKNVKGVSNFLTSSFEFDYLLKHKIKYRTAV